MLIPVLAIGALAMSGCGSSYGGSSNSAPVTPASSSPPSAAAEASTPVAADASSDLTLKAAEMSFTPATLKAKAGKVKITVENAGTMAHQLILLKTDSAPDALPVSDGQVSVTDSVGEIASVAAGASASHTFDLEPGHYVYICNFPGHYAAGMHGELVVE